MSTPHVTLRSIVGPDGCVVCDQCKQDFELRLWRHLPGRIVCPMCATPKAVADAVQEAREGWTK